MTVVATRASGVEFAHRIASLSAGQSKVYNFIARQENGATCDEVETALNIVHQSCSPLFLQLREMRLISHRIVHVPGTPDFDLHTIAEQRLTKQGKPAFVFVVNAE